MSARMRSRSARAAAHLHPRRQRLQLRSPHEMRQLLSQRLLRRSRPARFSEVGLDGRGPAVRRLAEERGVETAQRRAHAVQVRGQLLHLIKHVKRR